jgi:prepilin-type N-terminal cleavage/methylation domain-containing protein
MKRNKQIGFTLIELMVVVSIISVLSTIVLTALGNARKKASDSKINQELVQVRNAIELYLLNNNTTIIPGLNTLIAQNLIKSVPTGTTIWVPSIGWYCGPNVPARPSTYILYTTTHSGTNGINYLYSNGTQQPTWACVASSN